jgi:hypothetical protein
LRFGLGLLMPTFPTADSPIKMSAHNARKAQKALR